MLTLGSAIGQTAGPDPLPSASGAPLCLSLEDAIRRANALSPALETALTNAKIAAESIVQSRAAILPAITANSQYLYTEGNGTAAARYIANNGVHEYIAQGDAHEALSIPQLIAHQAHRCAWPRWREMRQKSRSADSSSRSWRATQPWLLQTAN